jgi:hypothetical protein
LGGPVRHVIVDDFAVLKAGYLLCLGTSRA